MAARKQKKTRLTPKQAQLEKEVKRINERINEIAKKLGAGSYAYNQWYATIKTLIPERYRTIDKNGLIKLKRSKEFYQTANTKRTKEAIARILGLKTSGQLRREAVQSLKEENALINKPDAVGIGSGAAPVPTPEAPPAPAEAPAPEAAPTPAPEVPPAPTPEVPPVESQPYGQPEAPAQ